MAASKMMVLEFRQLLEGVRKVDGRLPDELKAPALAALLSQTETGVSAWAEAEKLHKTRSDEAQAMLQQLNDTAVRVRAAVKGLYGGDSAEYQMVGGTRTSERKKPSRKTSTPPTV